MKTEINTLPIEVKELAVKVSANKQKEVQTVLQQIFTGTDDWEKQVDAIEVKDVNDIMSVELADVARKNAKQARLNAEKIFDAKRIEVQNLKAEFDLEDKLWLKAKQVMQIKFKAIEEKARWKADFVKRFEAEQLELRTQKRINEVSKYAEINRIEFESMSDESFKSFLDGLKATHDAKIEAERKAEEERLAKLKAEAEEQLRIKKENEELRKQALERERLAKIEADKRAKEEAIRQAKEQEERRERQRLADIEAKKRAKEEAIRQAKERAEREAYEAKLKAERDAKERIERELKAKSEAEAKAKADAEAKKEAELKKGDSEKFNDFVKDLEILKTKYNFKSKAFQKKYTDSCKLIDKIINHIS